MIPAEKKTRIVMSVIAGEFSVAEAGTAGEGQRAVDRPLEGRLPRSRKTALAVGKSGPSTREEQLEAEAMDLTEALGEAAVEIRV